MTLRRRDIVTVVPRSGDTATGAAVRGALGIDGDEIDGADAGALGRATAASTSSLRILPPTPVPFTRERSTPFSAASLRTMGVTYESSRTDEPLAGEGAGDAATGFGTSGGGVCGGVGTALGVATGEATGVATGGAGGGADNTPAGNGGSGIVVLRWESSFPAATSTTGSPTYNNGAGGYHVYTFTGSGSITI